MSDISPKTLPKPLILTVVSNNQMHLKASMADISATLQEQALLNSALISELCLGRFVKPYTLYTIHYSLYTVHFAQYTITLYTIYYTPHTGHYTLYSVKGDFISDLCP
jgi:hypothetical protein